MYACSLLLLVKRTNPYISGNTHQKQNQNKTKKFQQTNETPHMSGKHVIRLCILYCGVWERVPVHNVMCIVRKMNGERYWHYLCVHVHAWSYPTHTHALTQRSEIKSWVQLCVYYDLHTATINNNNSNHTDWYIRLCSVTFMPTEKRNFSFE